MEQHEQRRQKLNAMKTRVMLWFLQFNIFGAIYHWVHGVDHKEVYDVELGQRRSKSMRIPDSGRMSFSSPAASKRQTLDHANSETTPIGDASRSPNSSGKVGMAKIHPSQEVALSAKQTNKDPHLRKRGAVFEGGHHRRCVLCASVLLAFVMQV